MTDCVTCGAPHAPDHADVRDGWFCDHCGIYFDNTLAACPVCAAPVDLMQGLAVQADGHRWKHAK